ncbi:MAG: phosphate ABC transporter permease PstA [Chloroflexota bacterium]|nr:phosphate ABC transporter permease PstA [Chloroflexota bacterium]
MKERFFYTIFLLAILVGIFSLIVLFVDIISDGYKYLSWDFLTNYASRKAEKSGILAPLAGTLWLVVLTAIFTIPIGVSTALYLEEFASDNLFNKIIKINVSNLAGVPSIIYGLLGLAFFTYTLSLGKSLLSGALTMTLLVLPIVIIASQEAIRTIQPSLKDAAYALGATKWEVSKRVILPHSIGGIMSGIILAMSRAIGETAPILIISSIVFITTVPSGPLDRFTVLPLQIYTWASFPKDDFRAIASAGIIVLLFILIAMNSIAVYIRFKTQD